MPDKAIPCVSPYLRRPNRSLVEYLQERLAAGKSIKGFEPDLAKAMGAHLVPIGSGVRGEGKGRAGHGRRKPVTRKTG